ncbi:MAG TPA: type II toxin-antitoxin system RelE/ParE family toxin [Candidatus Paceibacterota bacterium]|mgnify:CR=1 FL=1|nr:type II toxin-antitoxin system RelE/ParE family toxin [Candidatus Paceibacterota bacterium]HMO82854.1 type II toxin-antitoxin system RelE/ParE family toxin [Candidatus Paceibacterota bacterium]
MAYTIVITKIAKRDIEALERVERKRLGKKLLHAASLSDLSSVAKQLTNSAIGTYRLRVGSYRVLFDIEGHTMLILRVQHRREVYR